MAEDPSSRNPLETEETPSSTGGLPTDFFDVSESPEPLGLARSRPARDVPLPPRLAGAPASPRVVIERRTSLPVVLVVIAGNILFFGGGGLVGWAAARKGFPRQQAPPTAMANPPQSSELVRAIDAKASRVELDALTSRLGGVQSELGTLGRELAQLQARLNARTTEPAAPPDLAPLRTRIDDLVEESKGLSPLPAQFESLRQRVDALDKGLNGLSADLAAVPKRLDASLNALKEAMAPHPAPEPISAADIARDLGATLFREGKYAGARDVFLALTQRDSTDARAWYFAALANGLTTGDWTGETERMVRRGVDCEHGGKPGRSEIDAQFSTLTKEQGKAWLDEWRKRASR